MGGWGLENPYGVRILNTLEIIGRSLTYIMLVTTTIAYEIFWEFSFSESAEISSKWVVHYKSLKTKY